MDEEVNQLAQQMEGVLDFEKVLGEGSFGVVLRVYDYKREKRLALKVFGLKRSKKSRVGSKSEYNLMDHLKGCSGVPKVYDYYTFNENVSGFTLELLGPNLQDVYSRCKSFSRRTVFRIGLQILDSLEQIHNSGFVHQDLKPSNILVGDSSDPTNLYLTDFGVSKKYFEFKTEDPNLESGEGGHISPRTKTGLVGTARYASLNSHLLKELSRRDDIESMVYLLVYFARGSLKWSDLDYRIAQSSKQQAFTSIQQMKDMTPASVICEGIPEPFSEILSYARGLNFKEQPSYASIRKILNNLLDEEPMFDLVGKQLQFEWEAPEIQNSPIFRSLQIGRAQPGEMQLKKLINLEALKVDDRPENLDEGLSSNRVSTSRRSYCVGTTPKKERLDKTYILGIKSSRSKSKVKTPSQMMKPTGDFSKMRHSIALEKTTPLKYVKVLTDNIPTTN